MDPEVLGEGNAGANLGWRIAGCSVGTLPGLRPQGALESKM